MMIVKVLVVGQVADLAVSILLVPSVRSSCKNRVLCSLFLFYVVEIDKLHCIPVCFISAFALTEDRVLILAIAIMFFLFGCVDLFIFVLQVCWDMT